jgi:hypothetical protein
LNRNNHYQVAFKIRHSTEIEFVEFIGQFGSKKTSNFEISSVSSDTNFNCLMKINNNLKHEQELYIQLACMYTDVNSKRYIRVINYKIIAESSLGN